MKTAATLLATCAVVLSGQTFGQPTPNCNSGCTVTVSISGTCGPNGANVKVSLDPIAIEKAGPGARRAAVIKWQMAQGSPWSFASDGIKFYNLDQGEFNNQQGPTAAAGGFTITNTPTKRATYKYDINLTRQVGGNTETCRKDPTVVNW